MKDLAQPRYNSLLDLMGKTLRTAQEKEAKSRLCRNWNLNIEYKTFDNPFRKNKSCRLLEGHPERCRFRDFDEPMPKCETCYDSGLILERIEGYGNYTDPCPDCRAYWGE